jgi:hypothetical protein
MFCVSLEFDTVHIWLVNISFSGQHRQGYDIFIPFQRLGDAA